MRPWWFVLLAIIAGCEGLDDIPNDRIVCCRNEDRLALMQRIDCVYDPRGRVVEYRWCDDAGSGEGDAASTDVDAGEIDTADD